MNNYMKISELPLDQKSTTVLLLHSVEEKETKAGKPFCSLELGDNEKVIKANLWNTTKDMLLSKVQEKSLLTVKLYPKLYEGAVSYEVYNYDLAPDGCDIRDFVIHAPYESAYMYDNILEKIRKEIPEKEQADLVDFAIALYEANKEKILYWSAAKSIHHNYMGGWLYHNFRMLYSAASLARIYTVIDKELLLAGCILHDIGKLYELETDELGVADYSVEGVLFGHAMIGIRMIHDFYRDNEAEFAHLKEKVMLLEHLIASHHKNLEWGAITVPATMEAALLHQIDMIDSRMAQYEDLLPELEPGTLSDKKFGLDGSRVYRPSYR